jgi:chromosome partitioning protein
MDIPVRVVDIDPQQSLLRAREKDLEKHKEQSVPYEIQSLDLSAHLNKLPEYIQALKKEGYHILFDAPGGMENEVSLHIILYSDYIIVPFQYESFSLDSTGRYARLLKKLDEVYPNLHRTVVFVPNMVNTRIGKASDRKLWDEWDSRIEAVGNKSPRVPLRACIQRRNSLFLTSEELTSLSPCFEYLTRMIFPELPESNKQ